MKEQNNDELINLALKIQDDSFKAADRLISQNPKISYQDAVNTYLYLQLARLQFQIDAVQNNK